MAYIGIDANGNRLKVAMGTFTASRTTTTSVDLGFKPKYLSIIHNNSGTPTTSMVYNEDYSTSAFVYAGASTYVRNIGLGGTSDNQLYSINNDGFTVNKVASGHENNMYFAIG